MRNSALVLFTCAGLLLSGGAILGGVTAWSLLRLSYYFWTTDLGVELAAGVLFVVGALLCLPTCWLCTVVPYHVKSHALSATLMALTCMSTLMLSLGLSSSASLSRAVRESDMLNASMQRALSSVYEDAAVKSSFASMQIEIGCCGVNSYSDWLGGEPTVKYELSLPPSCCGRVFNGKQGERCVVPLYKSGCLRPALLQLRAYVNSICTLAVAIIMVLGVTLFTASYMAATSVLGRSDGYKPKPLRFARLTQPPLVVPLASQNGRFVPPSHAQLQPPPALL